MFNFSHLKTETLANGATVFTDLEQGTPDWHQVRLGILTASEVGLLLVKGKRPDGLGAGALTAGLRIAGEIYRINGGYDATPESWSNVYTERGHTLEEEWRGEYEFITDEFITQVGFVRLDSIRFGGSPDALVAKNGVWECKSHKPEILIPMLLETGFPEAHKPQCLGNLITTDREYCDITAGFPGLPKLSRRLYREDCKEEESIIKEKLSALNEYVDDILKQLKAGDPVYAMAAE